MTNEQILQEISDAMKLNKQARIASNEALSHAANAIRQSEKNGKEYEQGAEDCKEAIRKLISMPFAGGLSSTETQQLFGTISIVDIIEKFSATEIIEKIKDYDSKKDDTKREVEPKEKPIQRGDHVKAILKTTDYQIEGILYSENAAHYWLLRKGIKGYPCKLRNTDWDLERTGKHTDLDALFD